MKRSAALLRDGAGNREDAADNLERAAIKLTAPNERIRKLEDNLYTTTAHYKCAALHRDQLMALLAAEREVSDKMAAALKVAQLYLYANHHSHNTVSAALAEVAALRKGEKA
jgi:hypothetical protein